MFLVTHGTEWPKLCWCAVKQLLTYPREKVTSRNDSITTTIERKDFGE